MTRSPEQRDDVAEAIRNSRETLDALAATDLPAAEWASRLLSLLEEIEEGDP